MLWLAHIIKVGELLSQVKLKHQGGGDGTIVNVFTSAWTSLELRKCIQSEEYL